MTTYGATPNANFKKMLDRQKIEHHDYPDPHDLVVAVTRANVDYGKAAVGTLGTVPFVGSGAAFVLA